jgi:hypothetical protein
MYFLLGVALLVIGYKILTWNAEVSLNFKDRPLVYSTIPLFSFCVSIASIAMIITGLILLVSLFFK